MRTSCWIALLALAGCARGARVLDRGDGPENQAPLWPMNEGYQQVLVDGDRLLLGAERKRRGDMVMPWARGGRTIGSSGHLPAEPAYRDYFSGGQHGVLYHGRVLNDRAPELFLPDTVRVGMRWMGTQGSYYEVLDRQERATLFGPGVAWTIRRYDATRSSFQGVGEEQEQIQGTWEDAVFIEGFGPESAYVPGGGTFPLSYTVVPLDPPRTDAPSRIAVDEIDTASLLDEVHIVGGRMSATEKPDGSYGIGVEGLGLYYVGGGGGIDALGWVPVYGGYSVELDPVSDTIRSSGDRSLSGFTDLYDANGEAHSVPYAIAAVGDVDCPLDTTCYFEYVGLVRMADGSIKRAQRRNTAIQPGLFLSTTGDDEAYIGDHFGPVRTAGFIYGREEQAGLSFFAVGGSGRYGSTPAQMSGPLKASMNGFSEGELNVVASIDQWRFFDVSIDGRVAELQWEDGEIHRVILGDVDVPDGHVVQGAVVIGEKLYVSTLSEFIGTDAQIDDRGRLDTSIQPSLGRQHLWLGRLPGQQVDGEHPAGVVSVELHQADALVCWDPEHGPAALEGWTLGGAPATAITSGDHDECVLVVRGPASGGDRTSPGAYRIEGDIPGLGPTVIGVDTSEAYWGYPNSLSRSAWIDNELIFEDGRYITPGGYDQRGQPTAGAILPPGLLPGHSIGPEFPELRPRSCDGDFRGVPGDMVGECCVRDGTDVTDVCFPSDVYELIDVADGKALIVPEFGSQLSLVGPDGIVVLGELGSDVLYFDGVRACGSSGCLDETGLTPFEGGGEASVADEQGFLYQPGSTTLTIFDTASMEVSTVDLPSGLRDGVEGERWELEHVFDARIPHVLYTNQWGTDKRLVRLHGGQAVLVEDPRAVLIGADAKLWIEDELALFLWPITSRPDGEPIPGFNGSVFFDVLRLPL